ncbi:hypothetical protein B566_EDAN007168 [Ephemera danica]|nr:hypothetical protein B566_EDAN007168 [Ephemera danica]
MSSWEQLSVSSLHSLVGPGGLSGNSERRQLKAMPRMLQPHFIALWKSLYDMFHAEPEDEETYHSIATIGTLLLQLGDVSKKFNNISRQISSDSLLASSIHADTPTSPCMELVPPTMVAGEADDNGNSAVASAAESGGEGSSEGLPSPRVREAKPSPSSDEDERTPNNNTHRRPQQRPTLPQWSITLEQFLASALTGPPIVAFFERKTNLLEAIDRFRKRRYVRLQSWPPAESSAQSPERKM